MGFDMDSATRENIAGRISSTEPEKNLSGYLTGSSVEVSRWMAGR
jgi:hypothetical protein